MLYVTHINKNNTISLKDSRTPDNPVIHVTRQDLETIYNVPILGVLRYPDSIVVKEIQREDLSDCFRPLIEQIQDDDVRVFANRIRRLIPKYFFEVPASSTGKYHPPCDLGKGGLVRHTLAVARQLVYIIQIESTKQLFGLNTNDIGLMLVACMMHDSLKSGWQEDYEKSHFTKFEHPLWAAHLVRGMKGFLPDNQLEFIAHCIESHMGQWNTSKYSQAVLPKPSDKYQWLVHLADYLASRKGSNFEFNNTTYVLSSANIVKIKDEKSKITNEDKKALKLALTVKDIKPEFKVKFLITRTDAECKDIWNSILNSESYSEKQEKYLSLAKLVSEEER